MADVLFSLFHEHQKRKNLSTNTVRQRQRTLRVLDAALPVPILHATTEHLERWLDSLDLAPRSRATYGATLRVFYKWCVDEGLLDRNPADRLVHPKLSRLIPRPISEPDLAYAMSQADPLMLCWLSLAAYAGLRCVEIANQQAEDVLADRIIVSKGKGGNQREVPLHLNVRSALLRYQSGREGHLFLTHQGTPYEPVSVSVMMSRYLHALGVPATAHMLRHRFASQVYQRSLDLRLTQHLLGHKSPTTTAIYAGFDSASMVSTVAAI